MREENNPCQFDIWSIKTRIFRETKNTIQSFKHDKSTQNTYKTKILRRFSQDKRECTKNHTTYRISKRTSSENETQPWDILALSFLVVLARLRLLTDTDYMAGWSGGKKQTSRHTSRNYQAIVWPAHHHINIPS